MKEEREKGKREKRREGSQNIHELSEEDLLCFNCHRERLVCGKICAHVDDTHTTHTHMHVHTHRDAHTKVIIVFHFENIFALNLNFCSILVRFSSSLISFSLVFILWTHFYFVLFIIVSVLV